MLDWDSVPAQEPHPGIRTRRIDGALMTVVLYEMEPNARFPLHQHSEEQLVIVLSGDVTFTAGNQEWHLLPDHQALFASDLPHGARVGPQGVRFINILAPRRAGNTIQYVGQ